MKHIDPHFGKKRNRQGITVPQQTFISTLVITRVITPFTSLNLSARAVLRTKDQQKKINSPQSRDAGCQRRWRGRWISAIGRRENMTTMK